ncbi:tol-pal system protein YbgF, partial [Pelagibacterales bacterium SAG-MED12]|nr:tol-pal system protein YbgF [Pelagibacterales bacterium SAG-MED12]
MKYSSSIKTAIFTFIINFFLTFNSFADNHNIYEILDQLQKDIKTLEKAVYS